MIVQRSFSFSCVLRTSQEKFMTSIHSCLCIVFSFHQIVIVDQLTVLRHSLSKLGYIRWARKLSFKQCPTSLFVSVLWLIEIRDENRSCTSVCSIFQLCIILVLRSYVPHILIVSVRIDQCKTRQCWKQSSNKSV